MGSGAPVCPERKKKITILGQRHASNDIRERSAEKTAGSRLDRKKRPSKNVRQTLSSTCIRS
jgi:hypothetical protein